MRQKRSPVIGWPHPSGLKCTMVLEVREPSSQSVCCAVRATGRWQTQLAKHLLLPEPVVTCNIIGQEGSGHQN